MGAWFRTTSLVAAMAGVAGCGGAPPPTAAHAETQAAMRSAEEVGAEESPRASYFLELASEQAAHAQELVERGDMHRAALAYERATADAELAIALADEDAARSEAEEMRDHIQVMRERYIRETGDDDDS